MTADRRFPPPRSIESVQRVSSSSRDAIGPRVVSASRFVLLGPLLVVTNFRQMQGKFARVP